MILIETPILGQVPRASRWIFFCSAIGVLALICLLVPELFSRFYYQQSSTNLRENNLAETRITLDKARKWLKPWASPNDANRIDQTEGDLYLRSAKTAKTVTIFMGEMEKAEKLFRAIVDRDSLNIDAYTGLAQATVALEKVYPFVLRQPFPNKPLPVFEKLLALMPVNIYAHSLLTKYYHSRKMTDELTGIVGQSVSLYPPLYSQLKQQPFYSMTMNEMLKKSLLKAVEDGVHVVPALKALADLARQEGDYPAAIAYTLQAKPIAPYKDHSKYYLDLGELYLKAEKISLAEHAFLSSLTTKHQEERLEAVWHKYKKKKYFNEFLNFCKSVQIERRSVQIEILQGKCLIEMGRYELALSHLLRIESPKYLAESFYLQGKIAELQKDWDTMELRSQRATVLEPGNSNYHLLFSKALKNQHKWPQAEQAAGDAIELSIKSARPNPWLYNHRAWIRWSRQDYEGAQQDWQSAIDISPRTAWFYESMARVFERGGNIKEALRYLKKAISLSPDEARFRKKYDELEKKLRD